MAPARPRTILTGKIYQIDEPEQYGSRLTCFHRVWLDKDVPDGEDPQIIELHEVEDTSEARVRQFILSPIDVGRAVRLEVTQGKHNYIKRILDPSGGPWRMSPAPRAPYLEKLVDIPLSMVDEAAHAAAIGDWLGSKRWADRHRPGCKYCAEK